MSIERPPYSKIVRQGVLVKIQEDLIKEGKFPTDRELLARMHKAGYPISFRTLYRDKLEINTGNTYVLDMAESNYSAYVETLESKISYVEEQALILSKEDWAKRTTVTHPDGEVTVTETSDEFRPKAEFLRIILDCQRLKSDILKGDVINVSAALIEKKFQSLIAENQAYKSEIKALKTKVVK